jgi:LPXTG-motif cell wall-anchored protein
MGKRWVRAGLAFGAVGATVVLLAAPADAAAVAANDDAAATTAGAAVSIDLTANDSFDGATSATVNAPGTTANGTNAVAGNVLTYTPNVGFTGNDAFTYELCATFPTGEYGGGSEQLCDQATVTVAVNALDTGPLGGDPYGGGDVSAGGSGTLGTGVGGSLPQTGISTGAILLALLGFASVGGGIACYGAGRDPARALVR